MTFFVDSKIQNARIEDTKLGFEDRGILTCMIYLDYGDGGHQGFGGYALGKEYTDKWLRGLLKVIGVDNWEDLKGKHVRARIVGGKIIELGHLLKDEWFDPKNL